MKQAVLLKQFEYTIPASSLALAVVNKEHIVAEHLPLMKVTIDFENGELKLQGDWRFMIAANKHNEASFSRYHMERVYVEASVYPELSINLNDPYSDGLVLPVEGSIKDGVFLSSCSGLVVIDNVRGLNGLISSHWNISFYLYDLQFDECEIKFKLPLYQTSCNENNN